MTFIYNTLFKVLRVLKNTDSINTQNHIMTSFISLYDYFCKNRTEDVGEYYAENSAKMTCTLRDFFMTIGHKAPYHLRYTYDVNHPHLLLVHTTDMSDKTNIVVQECNGLVLDKRTMTIVAMGMVLVQDVASVDDIPFYTVDGTDIIDENDMVIEASEDGTVMRVFYHDGVWHVSTNRCIDANRAKWGSDRSFYELLRESICGTNGDMTLEDVFEQFMSKTLVYSFILLHPDNHHVILHENPQVIAVSVRDKNTFKENKILSLPFAFAPVTLTRGIVSRLLNGENENNILTKKRGIIVSDMRDKKHVIRYKVDFPYFRRVENLRHNMPSMGLSYLAATSDVERKELGEYFSSYKSEFTRIDRDILNLAKNVHGIYRDAYIRRQYIIDPTEDLYSSLQHVHREYINSVPKEPMSLQRVLHVLQTRKPHDLHRLLYEKHAGSRSYEVKKIDSSTQQSSIM